MMIYQKIRELMTAPIFADDVEKTRISGMLNTILWASLVCIILFSIVVPFTYRGPGTILIITVAIFLIIVVNLFLLRRAYVYLTGMIFSLTIWIIITLLAILAGGVQTDAYKAYFMAILISGILVGGRTGILFAVLSILTGLVLIVAEANQLLPPPILASPSPISAWVSMTILFVMTAVWLQIASRSINDALDQTRTSNRQLQAYAQELEHQKTVLSQERDLTREVEKSLRWTTERLTILHQIEQGILAARSAEEIADTSLQQIQRLIPCQRISLAVFDYEADEAVLFAIVLHDDGPADIGRRIPLSAFSSLETLKQGEHYVLEDLLAVEDLTAVERQRLEEEGIRSYVNVPLIVRDKLIGSLNLAATQPNPWQPEHLEIAHEIADQLAIAVEQTRLLAAAERRANELEALRQISLEITKELDLNSLLQSIVFHAANILGADRGDFLLYRAERRELELVAKYGTGGTMLGHTLKPGEGVGGRAWQTGQPVIVRNYLQWEGHVKEVAEVVGEISLVSTPIWWGDVKLGVITLVAQPGERFDTADAELLTLFAANSAVAIENARLHDDVQRYVAQLEQEVIERKQIEQALQEQRDFAQQVLSQMGQGLTVADMDEQFTFVNKAFAKMVGREPEELIGANTMALNQTETSALEKAIAERRQGKISSYELRLQRADGNWLDILVTGVPRWQGNRVVGSIAVITDLTAQKEAEREREQLIAELEARNSELERFTYTVSHDLKSPLVTVKGFLGFLEKDIERGDRVRVQQDVMRIQEATQRMQLLLDDLLELSRIGRTSNPPQIISFNELVEEAIGLVAGQIADRSVHVHVMPNMPLVLVDRQRLVEVLQNLLDNGVKFLGEQAEPRIDVGWQSLDGEDLFFVKDNGLGIEAQFHEKVFGLFDRLDSKVEGTGIGLALVKRIIEVHNGRVWIESEGQGQGTAVCFTLPTQKPEES
jgi:PAS domain S-box-containing protein